MTDNYMYGDMSKETETEVTISKERYDELLEIERWQEALDAAGVDCWTGIEFAHEIFDTFNKA